MYHREKTESALVPSVENVEGGISGATVPGCQPTAWFASVGVTKKTRLTQAMDGIPLFSHRGEAEQDQL